MSRNYSNFAKRASLAASVAAGDASIDVDTQTDYPAPSYVIVVYEGAGTPQAAPNKEVMLVTGVTDNGDGTFTLDVNRDLDGYNGGGISFSDAATVEHTVVADEVGPKRDIVNSQILKPSSRLIAYDNFDRPDGALGGQQLPSGQQWEDTTGGNWTISNRRAQKSWSGGNPDEILIPETTLEVYQEIFTAGPSYSNDRAFTLILAYQDSNNWVRARIHRDVKIEFNNAGSVSQLASHGSTDVTRHVYTGRISAYVMRDGTTARFVAKAAGEFVYVIVKDANYPDLFTLLDNHAKIGIGNNQGGFVEYYYAYAL